MKIRSQASFLLASLLMGCGNGDPAAFVPPDASVLDFGLLQDAYAPVRAKVVLHNRGVVDWDIGKLVPSCGCVVAEMSEKLVKAGGQADLIVEFHPKGLVGPFHHAVGVQLEDHSYEAVSIRGLVMPSVSVSPPVLMFESLGVHRTVSISWPSKDVVKGSVIVTPPEGLTASIKGWVSEGGVVSCSIVVAKISPGAADESIAIHAVTQDGKDSSVTVPVKWVPRTRNVFGSGAVILDSLQPVSIPLNAGEKDIKVSVEPEGTWQVLVSDNEVRLHPQSERSAIYGAWNVVARGQDNNELDRVIVRVIKWGR